MVWQEEKFCWILFACLTVSFSIFNISSYSLLACRVSKKPANILMGFTGMWGVTFLLLLSKLFLWLLTIWLSCVSIWTSFDSPSLGYVSFLNLEFHFLPQEMKFLDIISLNKLSAPFFFWDSHNSDIGPFSMSYNFLRFSSLWCLYTLLACPLKQQNAAQLFFVLSGPQSFKVCQFLSVHSDKWDRN